MEFKKQGDSDREGPLEIDYENLNVAAVMEQIKKIAARHPTPANSESIQQEVAETEVSPSGILPVEGPLSFKQKIRNKIGRLMTPFFPLIRLLVLPVHEEVGRTIQNLHETNKRIDFLFQKMAEKDMSKDYIKLLHNLGHNLVVELTKLKIEEETLRNRIRIMEKDLEFLQRREKALEKRVFR
jgi:hypothetical protein